METPNEGNMPNHAAFHPSESVGSTDENSTVSTSAKMLADRIEKKIAKHSEKQTPPPVPNDVIVIDKQVLYYMIVAVIFFVVGILTGWVAFSARSNNIQEIRDASRTGAQTAIAEILSGQAQGPTPTAIPRQTINITNTMPAWGPANAKVTVVEFSDFQCPYCKNFYARTYLRLRETYADKVRFVFRHYPLTQIHPEAEAASVASECAKDQGKFWEYHDALFVADQRRMFSEDLIQYAKTINIGNIDTFTQCLKSEKHLQTVRNDALAGDQHFVNGTPTFFVNGQILVGAQSYERFAALIDQELAAAK